MVSSGLLRRVVLVRTTRRNYPEDTIFRMKDRSRGQTSLAPPGNVDLRDSPAYYSSANCQLHNYLRPTC
jgi:hypothetical protein